ncbi:outer membrane protein assembly factor BamA [Geothermobacter hydrogeniphilus]|uniref:Outer membrane protein assembly factor BamA n=1 Tax=Geothermobacter hydrogeniphilus TaxID=1969733 RepID=A0A2K2HC90_9BACT|nr:outer membrane protein assembly factor BamA [Geothermobacter hydrogeniphilus]PNU20914.1 outer membrane protein assembly factor BamA [Geothermobacter hydrogeniphilus]
MFKFICAVVALLICVASPAWSQVYRIDDVTVDGNRRVEKEAILPLLSVKPGQKVTSEQIDRDIQAIYKLGRFEDISAEIIDQNGAKILVYHLKERPLVRKVLFEGNDEFDDAKLENLVALKTPDIYEPRVVDESVKAMKKEYFKEGFYGIEIEPEVQINDRAEAVVTFKIKEGDKVLVDNILFDGNEVIPDSKLRKIMETKERWWLSWLTGRGTFLEDVLQNDLELIADQYFNIGYLQVKVRKPVILISEDRKYVDIYIQIEEGDQFRVGKLDIAGDLIKPKADLLAELKTKPGDIFKRNVLRKDVLKLNDAYADQGYAYVNVAPLTQLDTERRLVDLKFDIEKGPLVRINRIHIAGNTKTRDKVIRREVQLAEGELFSSTKIKASRRRINNLGFFEEVEVSTNKTANEQLMDIDIQVKERPTGNFSIGAGYSSIDGLIAQGSVSQDNFLGLALKLNLSGSFGGRTTTYNVGLLDPHFLDTRFALGGDLFKTKYEYSEYDRASIGGDIKLGFQFGEDNSALFIYRYEQKDITNVDPAAAFEIQESLGRSTISSLSTKITRDRTDYRLDPTRGYLTEFSSELAGWGGSEQYAKLILQHRHFFPFKWETYFVIHGQIGYLGAIGGKTLPVDEKFFLGGLSSIRGFDWREVGPRVQLKDSTGTPIPGAYDYVGGDKEAFANFEYIFPLIKEVKFKGVVFFDIGNAWDANEDYFSGMRYSTGAGIRWTSPMGPLRLEWGYNLDPIDGEQQSRFDFTMGKYF